MSRRTSSQRSLPTRARSIRPPPPAHLSALGPVSRHWPLSLRALGPALSLLELLLLRCLLRLAAQADSDYRCRARCPGPWSIFWFEACSCSSRPNRGLAASGRWRVGLSGCLFDGLGIYYSVDTCAGGKTYQTGGPGDAHDGYCSIALLPNLGGTGNVMIISGPAGARSTRARIIWGTSRLWRSCAAGCRRGGVSAFRGVDQGKGPKYGAAGRDGGTV